MLRDAGILSYYTLAIILQPLDVFSKNLLFLSFHNSQVQAMEKAPPKPDAAIEIALIVTVAQREYISIDSEKEVPHHS